MPSKVYVGNASNQAREVTAIYVGDDVNDSRRVTKVYVGDDMNQAKLAFGSTGSQTFDSNGTFTVPAGVYQIQVYAIGGGGGGSSTSSGTNGGSTVVGSLLTVTGGIGALTTGVSGSGAMGYGISGQGGIPCGDNAKCTDQGDRAGFGGGSRSGQPGDGGDGGSGGGCGGGQGGKTMQYLPFSVTPGQQISITIGAAGIGGSSSIPDRYTPGKNGVKGRVIIKW